MASKLEKNKAKLHEILRSMPEFKESKRGNNLYNATDAGGKKLKVQFDGNNLKVTWITLKVFSKPISECMADEEAIQKTVNYLKWRLTLNAKRKVTSEDKTGE